MAAITFDMSDLKPKDDITIRWVIVHRPSGGEFRFVSWSSELVREGTPEAEAKA